MVAQIKTKLYKVESKSAKTEDKANYNAQGDIHSKGFDDSTHLADK